MHAALIGGNAAIGIKLQIQFTQLCSRCTDAQILLLAGADSDTTVILLLIGIAWHQFHIHKRRFARLIKTLAWHHRIVPIQHLPFDTAASRLRRGFFPGKPVTAHSTAQ
ncbi:hypothetical protein D3C80_1413460 [compost metagenome]